ncbi:MAG: SirA family protein [Chloroflexi bacterium]|nr:SirA family protein [Chloroflexota bacterium]
MSDIHTVDARGLSCPQPAMLARQALEKMDKGTIEVLVDSTTARENVSRLARNSGWNVTVEDQPEGSYRIMLKK